MHTRYFELYAGSAQYFFNKRPAKFSLLTDIDQNVCSRLNALAYDLNLRLNTTEIKCCNAINELRSWHFIPTDFIYLDPPYPPSSRRNPDKKLYKFEMSYQDHEKLLSIIAIDMNARAERKPMIMISTRANDLYNKALFDWRKATFNTADRGGAAQEIIYMNYPEPKFLHQYDFAGDNYINRQCIKRKMQRFAKRIKELPTHEKHLFIQEIIKNDPDATELFMSMKNT